MFTNLNTLIKLFNVKQLLEGEAPYDKLIVYMDNIINFLIEYIQGSSNREEIFNRNIFQGLTNLEYIDLMFLHFPATEGLEITNPKHVENRHGSWKALEEFVE
jgi:hypothetical protein